MELKPLLVVVNAMVMAALSFSTLTPPCAGGTFQGTYLVRTCLAANPFPCSSSLWSQTYDQYCKIWCCPGSSTSVYNDCAPPIQNGCCRLRTDLGQDTPKIIYENGDRRVACPSTATPPAGP